MHDGPANPAATTARDGPSVERAMDGMALARVLVAYASNGFVGPTPQMGVYQRSLILEVPSGPYINLPRCPNFIAGGAGDFQIAVGLPADFAGQAESHLQPVFFQAFPIAYGR